MCWHRRGFCNFDEGDFAVNAWNELIEFLEEGETLESLVFGAWGWGCAPAEGEDWEEGYGEPGDMPVPADKRGRVLAPDEAKPLMDGWSFYGGYGAPDCYATYAWTNKRVIWVTQYDGATSLDAAPRNPIPCIPDMPGG